MNTTTAPTPQLAGAAAVSAATAAQINRLRRFRRDLYTSLPQRPDAILDLLDALASNTQARSPVELSLSPVFRRQYGSVYDAVDHFFVPTKSTAATVERLERELRFLCLLAELLPRPQQRKFWLFGIDRTPAPRRFAATLADRTYVHQPNTLRGNKPVTIGHDYSILAALPEKAPRTPPWLLPLFARRIVDDAVAGQTDDRDPVGQGGHRPQEPRPAVAAIFDLDTQVPMPG